VHFDAKQLLRHVEERKSHAKKHSQSAYEMDTDKLRAQYELEREQNFDALRLKRCAQTASHTARNQERVNRCLCLLYEEDPV